MLRRTASVLITLAVTAVGAPQAVASGAYQSAIDGCEKAIGAQLGISPDAASYKLKKVKSSARHRDLGFSVSARDAASPIQQVKVSCRARDTGEVLTVAFADPALPQALATH